MTHTARFGISLVVALGLVARPPVRAQGTVIGTFRWQLQPFCNVLTVTVVQSGAQYHIDGTDDQCGAPRAAATVGRAFMNPDGSLGFGLTTITTPGGIPLHLDATIAFPALNGSWRDSGGNSGTFAFLTGAPASGSARPVPAGGIAPGTVVGSPGPAGPPGPAGQAGAQGPQGPPGPASQATCPTGMTKLDLAHSTLCFATAGFYEWDAAEGACAYNYAAPLCSPAQWRSAVCWSGVQNPGNSWTSAPTGTDQYAMMANCSGPVAAHVLTTATATCCLEYPRYTP